MENSREVPPKLKIELPSDPAIPLLGIQPKEVKIGYQRDICIPMFTAVFTTAKIWKLPRCLSVDGWMDKEVVVLIHNAILFSHEKEGNADICDNMDGPCGHYAK